MHTTRGQFEIRLFSNAAELQCNQFRPNYSFQHLPNLECHVTPALEADLLPTELRRLQGNYITGNGRD